MQIGMIGLGRMGSNMVRRLMREGHECVVYNRHAETVPTPVINAALFERFSSRGNADYANRVLSAMRKQFGGHDEKKKEH